jgi:hypothetical protein
MDEGSKRVTDAYLTPFGIKSADTDSFLLPYQQPEGECDVFKAILNYMPLISSINYPRER